MPSITKNKITFGPEDWLTGLNPQYTTALTDVPAPQMGNGLTSAAKFNPFRFLGYAAPGFNATDVTTVSSATAYLRNVAFGFGGSANHAYFIGSDSKFLGLDIATKTFDLTHTIAAVGAITGNDICSYWDYNGTIANLFYSYNDAGGSWNIGKFKNDTGTFDDDFMSTVPATPITPAGNDKPHPLVVGADDVLYFADGRTLNAYDGATGATGTVYEGVLTLPKGYVITAMRTMSANVDYLVVFAYYSPRGNSVAPNTTSSGPAKAFFWDYLSLDPTFIVDLDDEVVTEAIEWNGTLVCFTQGQNLVNDSQNRNARVKIWDGSKFVTVATYIGTAPIRGGAEAVGESIQWNADGILYCYGSPFEGIKVGLNKLNKGAGTTSGVLRTIGGVDGYQVISTGATTSGGLQYMKASTYCANASVSSPVAVPTFSPKKTGKFTNVKVNFAKTSTGGAAMNLYLIKENSESIQILSALSVVTTANITQEYEFLSNDAMVDTRFMECRVAMEWAGGVPVETDAPIVRSVEVEFEEVNINT